MLEFSTILNLLLFHGEEILGLWKMFFKKMIATPAKIAMLWESGVNLHCHLNTSWIILCMLVQVFSHLHIRIYISFWIKTIGMWIALIFLTILAMIYFRLKRPVDEKIEPPSNLTMFLHPVQGEGDLFIGGLLLIFFFSQLFLELFQALKELF